jgi:hypothetical protein
MGHLFHVLRTVVPHVDLDSPGAVWQLPHDVEVRSGVGVPTYRTVLDNSPGDSIQSTRERHSSVPVDLIDGDVQFCNGCRRTARRKPVFFNRVYPYHGGRSVGWLEHRIVGESLEYTFGIIPQPRGSISFNRRPDGVFIVSG